MRFVCCSGSRYLLDKPEIVPVDLPEVHEGAAPAPELVVGVVLRHHYPVAVPETKYW
jgi:hypothetical protein